MARLKTTSSNGQSMVEYLLIATIIIGALVAIKPALAAAMNRLFGGAQEQMNQSANQMWELRLQ